MARAKKAAHMNQPEIMSQEEHELARIDAALEIVKARHPEFIADEQTLRAMAAVVRAEALMATMPTH
jgi:hypothetical protein